MNMLWKSLALAGLLATGACSSMPPMPAMPEFSFPSLPFMSTEPTADAAESASAADAETVERSPRERVSRAVELLGAGKEAEAKSELLLALAKLPKDTTALLLLRQIETDPVVLLGDRSESYVVQAGDTMSVLADRFLGDQRMFYTLSRYNGLAAPNALSVGRTLKVPPLTQTATRPTASLTSLPTAVAPAAMDAKLPDPARANAIRLQALQSLNIGDVPRAVALLKEAVSLDGTDPAIQRDLERAQRIQDALKAD